MATFYVTHHLYPENPQLFTITLKQVVKISGEPGTDFHYDHRGEHYWEVFVYTSGVGMDGNEIPPILADVVGSETTVDELVASKVSELCSKIDWSVSGEYTRKEDRYSPVLVEQYPSSGQTGVPINSTIRLVLRENLPSMGMDVTSVSLKVKGVSVMPVIEGNPYDYTITFTPKVAR